MKLYPGRLMARPFAGLALLAVSITGSIAAPVLADDIPTSAVPVATPLSEQKRTLLFPGGQYRRLVRGGSAPVVVHVVRIDLRGSRFHWRVTPADRSKGMEYVAHPVSDALRATGALIAINASYFLPFAGGSPKADDFYPHEGEPVNASGAVISGGRIVSPRETDLDIRVNAMVCFRAARATIVDGQRCPRGTRDGVAAGPVLLMKGVRRPFLRYDNQYALTAAPRSAIGFSADGATAWIVAVDGRQAGTSDGMTLPELTGLFEMLGASDALNLDGGGSTALVVKGSGRTPVVVNKPIHTGVVGRERPVANVITLFEEGVRKRDKRH